MSADAQGAPFVTIFRDVYGERINTARTMDLEELERVIRNAPAAAEKEKLPLLKFAQFGKVRSKKNGFRHDENVLIVSGVEGDYDGGAVPMSRAAQVLSAVGLGALLYTSSSHTPDFHKWRVLAALSTPLEGTPKQLREQRRHWTGVLNAILGGILETESFVLSQSYFFGPIKGKKAPEILRLSGACLDQLEEIPKPVFTAKSKAANGVAGEAHDKGTRDPTPDADLLEAFKRGRDRTPAMLKLSSRWAARGMVADDIEANLLALLDENYLNHAGVDLRTRARPAAESAVRKYGESRRAPNASARAAKLSAGLTSDAVPANDRDNNAIEPLDVEPASLLADRDPPPARDWICEGIGLPAGRVTSLIGNGGFGKSTVAHQIAIASALSRPLFGMPVSGGKVFGLFCEDEQPELDRKTRAICRAEGIDLGLLDGAYLLSRDGKDNILCTFDRDQILLTEFYWQVDATFASLNFRLGIFDTAADLFAGDFMSTPHVRQFIKVALGGLCQRHNAAILLLAHPSASAMQSGDGAGFSTAWSNSVRSRWYLRRPKSEDAEAIADRRVLEIRKANYGPSGSTVPLLYSHGRFVLDPEPIEESRPIKAIRTDTRLSMAVMEYFKAKAASGQVVSFGNIFEALQATSVIPCGNYETVRKPLQRTLKDLIGNALLSQCDVPRGYRLSQELRQ